ncbi:hypothetical protein A4X13_0g9321, partial [Tilletia indica]
VNKRSLSSVEKEARKKAYALDWIELFEHVRGDAQGFILVTASSSSEPYRVNTNLSTCSCPAYASTELTCKHMFMASRFIGQPIPRLRPQVAPSSSASTEPPPPAPLVSTAAAVVSSNAADEQNVLEEKQDKLRQIVQESNRLLALCQQKQGSAGIENRVSRAQLEQVLANIVAARRDVEAL